jgi:hypothetical protein
MNSLKNMLVRYAHRHHYEVVACADYIHVNKFTAEGERFPALLLRCPCGQEKAEAVISSPSVSVTIPIDVKKWAEMTVPAPRPVPGVVVAKPVPMPVRPSRPRPAATAAIANQNLDIFALSKVHG